MKDGKNGRDISNNWVEIFQGEDRIKKISPKIRKPPRSTEWFGCSTESEDNDTDSEDWKQFDKKKRNEEKTRWHTLPKTHAPPHGVFCT